MIISNYFKRPLHGIFRIWNKFCDRLRGIIASIEYRSGHNLLISNGVRLDSMNITFGNNVRLSPHVHIFGSGKLVIGDNIVIGDGTVICVADQIVIGNDTMIAAQCYITDCNHGTHQHTLMRMQKLRIKKTLIGDNCWIGCGCKILSGSIINNDTVIGAGIVLNNEIIPNSFVVGERKNKITERV